MIREVSAPQSIPCNVDDTDLYLNNGLLNPSCFDLDFKRFPWYPFEDLSFETDETYAFVDYFAKRHCSIFRQTIPREGAEPRFYEFSSPTKMDAGKLKEWLWLDENIVWASDGTLIINKFSDVVILAWPDTLYKLVFGQSGEELFKGSESIFTRHEVPAIQEFMELIRLTWDNPNRT